MNSKRTKIGIIVILIVILVGVGGYMTYTLMQEDGIPDPVDQPVDPSENPPEGFSDSRPDARVDVPVAAGDRRGIINHRPQGVEYFGSSIGCGEESDGELGCYVQINYPGMVPDGYEPWRFVCDGYKTECFDRLQTDFELKDQGKRRFMPVFRGDEQCGQSIQVDVFGPNPNPAIIGGAHVWIVYYTGDCPEPKYRCNTTNFTCEEDANGSFNSLQACNDSCFNPIDISANASCPAGSNVANVSFTVSNRTSTSFRLANASVIGNFTGNIDIDLSSQWSNVTGPQFSSTNTPWTDPRDGTTYQNGFSICDEIGINNGTCPQIGGNGSQTWGFDLALTQENLNTYSSGLPLGMVFTYEVSGSLSSSSYNFDLDISQCSIPDEPRYTCNLETFTCQETQNGIYQSLSACQDSCVSAPRYTCNTETYTCEQSETGEYDLITFCQNECVAPPTYTCNTNNYTCEETNNGEFQDINSCEENCNPPELRYTCNTEIYSCELDESGEFTTITACNENCVEPIKYTCNTSTFTCDENPDGIFNSLPTCQDNCIFTQDDRFTCDINTYTCRVDAEGDFADLGSCQDNCNPPVRYTCNTTTYSCEQDPEGEFADIGICGVNCEAPPPPPEIRYVCNTTSYTCSQSSSGNYSDLTTCQNDCIPQFCGQPCGGKNGTTCPKGHACDPSQNRCVLNDCIGNPDCTNNGCSLPKTAIYGDSRDYFIYGAFLMLVGLMVYKMQILPQAFELIGIELQTKGISRDKFESRFRKREK